MINFNGDFIKVYCLLHSGLGQVGTKLRSLCYPWNIWGPEKCCATHKRGLNNLNFRLMSLRKSNQQALAFTEFSWPYTIAASSLANVANLYAFLKGYWKSAYSTRNIGVLSVMRYKIPIVGVLSLHGYLWSRKVSGSPIHWIYAPNVWRCWPILRLHRLIDIVDF